MTVEAQMRQLGKSFADMAAGAATMILGLAIFFGRVYLARELFGDETVLGIPTGAPEREKVQLVAYVGGAVALLGFLVLLVGAARLSKVPDERPDRD
jgi:hypothetical protein